MKNLYHMSAFPKNINGGNLAGVYLFADDLNDFNMQKIAYEVGYSETAFVMKSDAADFKVRFFTPIEEVNLCGHATIATFNLLRDLKIIKTGMYTQETKAGILRLDVKEKMVFMEQPSPLFFDIVEKVDLEVCFHNLKFHDVLNPQIVSTGIREIFLPVKNVDTLNCLIPINDEIIKLSQKYNVIGIHAFALDDDIDAYGRNFAPIVGIDEESATGTSNGALGSYLFKYLKKKNNYILRQGYSMNLPSEIITIVESDNNHIDEIWVGGTAINIKTS
ncbi:PhzF family phenazine biosynthesis protein [Candidatus Izemoplasma sp. B36]|uniref:PhzF family phenazine biosynthesis protein n=1 Tax=Candidatus Izemoplasma sp. B36 TaxID=3242468 RepID=UPI003556B1A2